MKKGRKQKTPKKERGISLQTILDSVTEGVFTVDRDWNITSFNLAAEKITGYPKNWAVGKKCFEVFHADICQTGCVLRKTIETNKNIMDLPITILNKNGKLIPISISTAALKDERGRIMGGVETFRDLSAIELLKKEISKQYTFEDIISKNHQIQKIFDILPDIAESDSTVLIQGESGTGKELLAKAIHNLSPRRGRPYVVVNCAALPETLLESELFGYVKGAFTDAKKDKPGRFALAEGGTIFLDEVGDIPFTLQAKLLRVLQEKEYEPLGAISPRKANVRIIGATNKDLLALMKEGRFREDLYYRLNVVKIELPPLSQRREDIPLLIEHFINHFNLKMGKKIQRVSQDVMDLLMRYDFPGNIRELENIIEHAFVLCRGAIIERDSLPKEFVQKAEKKRVASAEERLRENEIKIIRETLEKYFGHRGRTAKELGIDKSTLWRKMKKYGIH
ncbi:MAG TPA: PAS domain-containing protein [Syntrophaceae bacterium]|nr:PAS domain-containing protein [Syntrophaceae bacterium]